ncbi:MAG TPA: ABC transporter ATP-binding protein [Actinomycetota bacterium]
MSEHWAPATEDRPGAPEDWRPSFTHPPLVEVRGVSKSYRRGPEEVHALRGADLTLHEGELVALVGPSGSGKTTLLNVLCGWEHPDGGEVRWPGDEPDVLPERRLWSDIAILPQDLGLLEELSVGENVGLPLRLGGSGATEHADRVTDLLESLGLGGYVNRAPGEISMGEQQRVALARALVVRPRLVLADEPTGHQDAEWAAGVFRAFRDAADAGTCCLVATHSEEFLRYADRVLTIRDGIVHESDGVTNS